MRLLPPERLTPRSSTYKIGRCTCQNRSTLTAALLPYNDLQHHLVAPRLVLRLGNCYLEVLPERTGVVVWVLPGVLPGVTWRYLECYLGVTTRYLDCYLGGGCDRSQNARVPQTQTFEKLIFTWKCYLVPRLSLLPGCLGHPQDLSPPALRGVAHAGCTPLRVGYSITLCLLLHRVGALTADHCRCCFDSSFATYSD